MQNSVMEFVLQTSGFDKAQAELNSLSRGAAQVVNSINRVSGASGGAIGPTQGLEAAVKRQEKAYRDVAAATDADSRAKSSWFVHIAKTTVMSAMVNKSFLALTNSMAAAAKQIDLIENFPGAMSALGVSADESSVAFQKLREYVQGVGGDIADATSAVSRFTQVNKNVQASVALYAGVNNALIAGGAAAEAQAAALEQLVQGYSRGRFEGEEWRSMATSMSLAMNEAAKALNQPSTQALQVALVEGEISMNKFMTTLANVSTGTGPVAQAAMAQMQGIGFATTVMSNTLTNGLTAIYQAVGRQNIVAFFTLLTGVIATLASWAVTLINILISLFNFLSGLFGGPQISNLAGETAAVAGNLNAGANAAEGVGDGLDKAGKAAKKLNKQLASFDKMNVLQDKESGSGGKDAGSGGGGAPGGFNPGELGDLGKIFDGINGKLQEASIWAKILAGVLAGIAGIKFAQGILDQLNSIGKTAETTRSNFQKMKDNIANLPTVFVTGFDKAKTAITGFGKFLLSPLGAIAAIAAAIIVLYNTNEEFRKGWDDAWVKMKAAVDPVVKVVKDVFAAGIDYLKESFDKLKTAMAPVFEPLKPLLDEIGKVLEPIVKWVKDLFDNLKIVEGPMDFLAKALMAIGIALVLVLNPWLLWVGLFVAIAALAVWMAGIVMDGIVGIGEAIAELVYNGMVFFQDLWWKIVAIFVGVGIWFSNKFQEAWTGIKNIWSKVEGWFRDLWWKVVAVFIGVDLWFKEKFQAAWDKIVEIWNKIPGWFGNLWTGIKNVFSTVGDWFKEKFQAAWDGIKNVWGAVSKWFGDVWNEIKKIFADPVGYFKDKFQKAWDGIKGIWSAVRTFFDQKWNDIKGAFSWERISQLGSDIVRGLWNGINNMGRWIKDKITGFGSTVLNSLKDFFKIKSPSRVLRDEVGKMIGAGLAVGITDSTSEAVSAAEGAANGVLGVFSDMETSVGKMNAKFSASSLIDGAMDLSTSSSSFVDIDDVEVNDESWIDKLANRIVAGGQKAQVIVKIGEDQITDKIVDLINDKTYMTGQNVIDV